MKSAKRQWRAAAGAAGLLACVLLAGCASGSAAMPPQAAKPGVKDGRLFGVWHVKSITIAGQRTLTADWSTTAKVRFRRDGLVVVNGDPCGAPHFETAGDKIALHWPASSDCSDFEGGTKVALHISAALDNLTSRSRLTYALRSGKTLTLVGGRYRADVQAQPIKFSSPTIGPSSPGPR